MTLNSTLLVAALLAASFAGCLGSKNQIEARSINLAYEGTQSGNHESTGTCDSEGTLTGHGTITDGSVRLMVRDGSGNVRFDQTYTRDFTIESQGLSGASGSWKVSGDRASGDVLGGSFKGSYTLTARC